MGASFSWVSSVRVGTLRFSRPKASETRTDAQPDENALSAYLEKENVQPTYAIGFLR